MQINWKVRVKNPLFWVQIAIAIIVPILGYFGMSAEDVTSWGILFETLKNAVLNPYVIVLVLASVFNAITDPTTKGIGDSKLALTYTEPKPKESDAK